MKKHNVPSNSRLICLALAVCILMAGLLTGCDKPVKNDAKMGRYVEQSLTTLDGTSRLLGAKRHTDGKLTFYSVKNTGATNVISRNVLSENGSVESAQLGWLDNLIADGGRITDISEGDDGAVYALYTDQTGQPRLARSTDGLTSESIEIPDWDFGYTSSSGQGGFTSGDGNSQEVVIMGGNAGARPKGVIATKDGFLILDAPDGVSQYSKDGALIRKYEGTSGHNTTAVYGDTLAVADLENTQIILYSLGTGSQTETIACDMLSNTSPVPQMQSILGGQVGSAFIGLDENGLFAADTSGIYRNTADGWQMLVDGQLTSLMTPTLALSGIISGKSQDFYAFLGSQDYQLMRYAYNADIPNEPSTTLEIFSLYDNKTIRQAIGEFQRKNPDVRITLRVAMAEAMGATTEDVIRALNTELLAGKGPDLIVLDGLTVDSYIEKGVLKNINVLGNRLISEQGLFENLMNTYTKNDKTYALPSRFVLPVMLGEKDSVQSLRSLSTLADAVEASQGNGTPFLFAPSSVWRDSGVLMDYYEACVDNWTREDGSIDQAALAKYLADVLRIDKVLKAQTPQNSMGLQVSMGSDLGMEAVDMAPRELRDEKVLAHIQSLNGVNGVSNISLSLGDRADMGLASLFGENKYYPRGSVGITATSKQQSVAEAFIETLLSGAVQNMYLYDGFPVNGKALEKMIQETLNRGGELSDMGFLKLCGELKNPVIADQVVKDAVQAQIKDLLSGAVTPEQAAARVVESTKLYLTE